MTERRESSRNLQFEAKDDTKLKQKDKEKEKSRAKTSDDLDKIKSDDKNTTEKRAALKRSHSKSGSLTTKSITRKESSHLTLSPTDKRSGSPTVSLELTKSDDSALKSQREQSTPPTSAKLSKSEEKPNPMESSLGATKETPKDGPSISEESEPTPEQLNDIEYWKKRCGDLDQEVEKLKYANKSLEEQVRQQRLLIEKFLPNSPGAASHPKPIQRTNSSGDAKEEVEKRTKEKKEEEIVPKLQLETFKRVHKPAILSKKDPDDRTRVVGEMLTTEQSYLHGIEIMLNNYLYPLRKAAQKDKENAKKDVHKKVESSDVDSIFLNIEQLHLINSNLYEQLLKRLEDWEANDTIGDLLAEWAPKLKPYCRYGGNYEAAIQRVQELKERNVQFAKILDACDQQSNAFNGLSLRDYMIMPVQRVPRYSMLFHDLLKKTDKSHRDYEKLTVACLEIEKTANAVNEQIRQFQNETKLAEIYNRGGNFMILKDSYRRFVRDWNMEVVMDMNDKKFGKKEGELILFNDLFVASNFIMRKATLVEAAQVIPLMWIEVDIAKRQKWMEQLNAESLSAENAVVLYGPERAWFVKAKNLKERNEFVDSIAKVVGIADMSDKAAMREGTRKGSFTFTMPKGHYDGEWMAGQMHGRGRYVRDDGAVFDGYWDARIMAGFGIVTLPDQEAFPSGWLNNRTTEGGNVEVASKEHDFWGAGGLTDSDWQVLLLGAQEVTMKKDEKIIEQGITNENLYKVKSGTIRVEKQLPDGSKKLLVKLGANETFGDTSVLQSLATATASVIADSDQVVLRVIQIDLVFEIFKNNPGLCMRFYRQMATKLAERLRNLHNKAPLPKKDELKAESPDGPGSSGPASTASSGEHPSLTERLSTRNLKRISMHSADLDSNSGTSTPRENTPSTERKKDSKDKKDKEKEKDKKKQVAEVSFHEKFDLPLTEVVIKEVRCEIKMSTSKKPGQMYISQRYVCFDSSLFGSHTKEVVQLSKVIDISMKKKDLKLKMKKNQFTFIFNTSLEEAHSLIVSLWEKAKQEADGDGQTSGPASTEVSSRKLESRPSRRISLNPQTAKASLEPKATEEDWRLVLQGAKDLHFQKDQVILKEGVEHQCVYQIVHGNCRIEKETPEGTKKVLGSMEQGQLFGEMSFLQGGGATVSVVADEEVTVYVIEGDYINALFGRYPDLAGRFYHFLSSVLANRLNKRESDLAKAEEKAKSRRAKSKRVSTQSTDLSADDAEHRKSRKLLGDSADDLAKSSEDGASGTEKKRRKKKDRESGDDWSKLESQINAKHDEVEGEFARANSNLVNIPEDKEGEKKKKAEGESGPTSDNPKKIRKTKSTRDTKKDALNPTIVVEEETK